MTGPTPTASGATPTEAGALATDASRLLEVSDLQVGFDIGPATVPAVRGVSFTLEERDGLALVGESGSGKTVTARTIMGILRCPPGRVTGGQVRFRGEDLLRLPESRRRTYRGTRISMIFQEALAALNPVLPVGYQIGELFRFHQGSSRRQARRQAIEAMSLVQIPHAARRAGDYPHQFSGGMRQRVVIAMALALRPDLVIADEPTTALDVTIQAQVMELLQQLLEQEGMSLLLITHDLGVAAYATSRIAVMYAGRIVETGPLGEVYPAPAHPYTYGLMESIRGRERESRTLHAIPGAPPDLTQLGPGCPFAPRCPRAVALCREVEPPLDPVGSAGSGRASACHFAAEILAEGVLEVRG
ncbi:MAG: ATP-binding cassette domain-containing protein [Micromonosporaceae bacterium]|nr:ATP-binding cassette domain-containing protein [Micromonosporaceae bacterium]